MEQVSSLIVQVKFPRPASLRPLQCLKVTSHATGIIRCIFFLKFSLHTTQRKMLESERQIAEQLDVLISTLERKKADLTERLRAAREEKVQLMREQITQVTQMLTKSTGLIQFCIEMLKEGDPTAFLVVSQSLVTRTHETENVFIQELEQASAVSDHAESVLQYSVCSTPNTTTTSEQQQPQQQQPQQQQQQQQRRNSPRKTGRSDTKGVQRLNDLTLEQNSIEAIRRAINELRLSEEQSKKTMDEDNPSVVDLQPNEVPTAPRFTVEACIAERNVITLVWQPTSSTLVTKYTLELDDGANGNFRKVYRGPETICTVEGLHFRSVYRARVKAHNPAGESLYSERLCLQTSDLTWFHMDPSTACPDLLLTNGNRTITSQINEDRVILGSTGLSRGVHYWEFTVDRCDPGGQPAFGIARVDCNKEIMLGIRISVIGFTFSLTNDKITILGLDMRSWSVYFDHKRSWFLHNGEHFERTDGGVRPGSVVGVRLDFNRGSLSYYLNDEPHGPIAFTNLPAGVYYPAISLSRAVQLTLHSGLEAPSESEESDEDSSGGGTGTETTSMATTVLAVPSSKSHSHQST
ncbi:E3 ubiquitin-protein ligase [Fasciolopsis buskii]|uniref:E3 ubiquitin-protein ligase n=1 Tax=Fasciolopsis buskii TaxID=27845 RepID=A0A8E0RPR9_9TREM|nr:E3 ubiquitin-protein ligase [Fasciolopsis buski]